MKFGPVSLEQAQGKILGHNIAGPDGRRVFRKGKPLTAEDIDKLRQLGRETVYVAALEANDVDEDTAAKRIATAGAGDNLYLSKAITGRANIHADTLGIFRVDEERLMQINLCEAVTLATLPNHAVVTPRKMVGTLKIIAYGIPEAVVREAEVLSRQLSVSSEQAQPVLRVDALPQRKVGLILSGSPSAKEKIVRSFEKALRPRLEMWGSKLEQVGFIPLEDEQGEQELAQLIDDYVNRDGMEMVLLAGETAIMDRYDIAPRAVERAGGRITCFGAPVDPGNLLMLGRYRDVPIVGAPGCSRSPKLNIVDLVIPRLLAGDYLTKLDIVRLGHGGMIEDVAERPLPRKKIGHENG